MRFRGKTKQILFLSKVNSKEFEFQLLELNVFAIANCTKTDVLNLRLSISIVGMLEINMMLLQLTQSSIKFCGDSLNNHYLISTLSKGIKYQR